MPWLRRHPVLSALLGAAALSGAFVGVGSLRAEGVPESNTLVYTGRLVEDGVPVNGTRDIRITLWSHPDSTDATAHRLCRVVPGTDTSVADGYFRIPLDADDDSCEQAVANHSEIWVEVAVEGTTLAPRTQIGAVPYALEANRASGAAGDLRRELDELVPAGTIIAYGGEANATAAPPGWILCDGRALSSTDPQYRRLFLAIRTAWGNGTDDADPATDFNAPDLRGRFLRGVDQGAGHDPESTGRAVSAVGGNEGDAVGTEQQSQFALHDHGGGSHTHTGSWSHRRGSTADSWGGNVVSSGNWVGDFGGALSIAPSGTIVSAQGGTETRPANLAVNYLIRL